MVTALARVTDDGQTDDRRKKHFTTSAKKMKIQKNVKNMLKIWENLKKKKNFKNLGEKIKFEYIKQWEKTYAVGKMVCRDTIFIQQHKKA